MYLYFKKYKFNTHSILRLLSLIGKKIGEIIDHHCFKLSFYNELQPFFFKIVFLGINYRKFVEQLNPL
jgi:hypothetical protein